MSSPQNSGTQRTAHDKSGEGWRLLGAGDYEGAIAACTEAIELDPSSLGARRTRAEALKRLGRENQAAADLNILRDRSGNLYEEGDPRPALCARLGQLGVRARPAGREKRAVDFGYGWLIDVAEGPIRQVLISNIHDFGYDGPSEIVRRIAYLVPDSRVGPNFLRRGVPLVVVPSEAGVKRLLVGAEAIGSLNRFTKATAGEGAKVSYDPDQSCWWLTEGVWREREIPHWTHGREPNLVDGVAARAPSRLQWDGYQAIARQVLEAPVLAMRRRQPTEGVCAVLRDLGVQASVVVEGPFTEEPGVRWVHKRDMGYPFTEEPVSWAQIADGPTRWVDLGLGTLKAKDDSRLTSFLSATWEGPGFETLCYVPDARLGPDSPRVRMVSDRVKSFPLFGRVKRVRWQSLSLLRPDLAVPGHTQKDKDFGIRVSESLGQDPGATEAIKASGAEICVVTDPDCGCWVLAADDRPITKWTRPLWDCCQAVAERLLAMPIPSGE